LDAWASDYWHFFRAISHWKKPLENSLFNQLVLDLRCFLLFGMAIFGDSTLALGFNLNPDYNKKPILTTQAQNPISIKVIQKNEGYFNLFAATIT